MIDLLTSSSTVEQRAVNSPVVGSNPTLSAIFMQITQEDINKKPFVPYALDRGAPKFELIDVKSKKDQNYNLATQQAQKEFENLKQIADVINKQAQQIKERLEISELIYHAEYNFVPVAGGDYWLVKDTKKDILILCLLGPKDWSTDAPLSYNYIAEVKYLANGLWEKI